VKKSYQRFQGGFGNHHKGLNPESEKYLKPLET